MPYKSEAQKRLMQAVAHNPKFAKKVGISQSVGRKFEAHKQDESVEVKSSQVSPGKAQTQNKLSEEIPCTATGNVANVDKPMGETKKKTYKERNMEDGIGGPEGRRILSFKEWIEESVNTKVLTDLGSFPEDSGIHRYAVWAWNPNKRRHEVIDTDNDLDRLVNDHKVDKTKVVPINTGLR